MYTHTYIYTQREGKYLHFKNYLHTLKKSKHKPSGSYRQLTKIGRALVIHDLKPA